MTPPRGYLPTLDGWRALAILGVMVTHATDALLSPGAPFADATWYGLTRLGAKGVDLFFGISGLLICSRLLEEHEARGTISLKGFYVRRFLRILPPYAVFLVTLALLALAGVVAVSSGQLVASALFVRNYLAIAPDAGWYTGHLWSLAVEEHFYLLWPGLLVLWTPPRARRRVALLALAIAAWRVVEFRFQLGQRLLPGLDFYGRTDIRLDALLWGCWVALALRDPAWRARLERWLAPPGWLGSVALLIAVLLLNPPLAMLWEALLIPLVLAGTVLRPEFAASRALEWPALRWVGRISYSLYLWQQLFLVPLTRQADLGVLQRVPLNVAAVFACAALSYYLVERPMMRLGHRLAPPTTEGRV